MLKTLNVRCSRAVCLLSAVLLFLVSFLMSYTSSYDSEPIDLNLEPIDRPIPEPDTHASSAYAAYPEVFGPSPRAMAKVPVRAVASTPKSGTLTIVATGYCNCAACCGKETGITASGVRTSWGTIAAPKGWAFGTQLTIAEIPGVVFTVRDRGGAINGNRIDIWFPSHQEALNWGKRTIHVTVR